MKSKLVLLAVLIVRALSALGATLLSFVVGRYYGVEGLGQFAVFLGVVGVASIVARQGLNISIVREAALSSANSASSTRLALLVLAARRTVPGTVATAILGAVLLASGLLGPPLQGASVAFVVVLPAVTFFSLISGYLQATGRPWLFPVFEVGGFALIATAILLPLMVAGVPASGPVLFLAISASLLPLLALSGWVFMRDMPSGVPVHDLFGVPPAGRDGLIRGQWDFTVVALAAFATQAGAFVVVGPFLDPAAIGTVRAAERFALLVSFSVLAVNPFISPLIVQRFGRGDRAGVYRLLRNAVIASAGFGLPVLVVLMIWPEFLLGLVGEGFVAGAPFLRIMALAHFVFALVAVFQPALAMTGGERRAMVVAAVFLVLSLVLYPLSAIVSGPAGFVAAYVVLLVARSVANLVLALRQLNGAPRAECS